MEIVLENVRTYGKWQKVYFKSFPQKNHHSSLQELPMTEKQFYLSSEHFDKNVFRNFLGQREKFSDSIEKFFVPIPNP